MSHVRVLFLTAVLPEARALARAFHLAEPSGPAKLWVNAESAMAIVGVRASRLPTLADLSQLSSVQLVIMAGVAGALSPQLQIGDVVVDARHAKAHLPPLGPAIAGRLHTSSKIISTSDQKAELFRTTGCLAVDMETDPAATFAAARGAAFLAVRGISDTARDPLDPALLTLVDPEGRPRIGRAIAMILRHPQKLPAMLNLKNAIEKAMANVVETIKILTASGWPAGAADRQSPS